MGKTLEILLVEDNRTLQKCNQRLFELKGYSVRLAMNLAEAKAELLHRRPDVIVLDILLPDGNGLDFLANLRKTDNTPVLLLTSLSKPDNIVEGLEHGGDAYLTKPYDFAVLLAKVEALLRRTAIIPKILKKGSLTLDITSNHAWLKGKDIMLTQKEFSLLLLLVQNEGRTLSMDYLYETIWLMPVTNDSRTLKKHISLLRKKLTDGGCEYTISVFYGKGYKFERV